MSDYRSQRRIAESLQGRYDRRDFETPKATYNAHYDRLREFNIAPDEARALARRAIDKTLRKADEQAGGCGVKSSTEQPRLSSKFRVPFDWEK